MKIKFARDTLIHATDVVHSLVLPQTSLPILGNILIRAVGDEVTFFTCDMESTVRCTVKAQVEEGGEITVPATPFNVLVRELPETQINLWLDEDENVHIEAEQNVYRLQTMSPTDFPTWSDFEPITSFEVEQKALKRMIDKIIFAIPPKDPRKVLLGAYLTVNKNLPPGVEADTNAARLRMVATDGKKLAYIDACAPGVEGEREIGTIIPQKVLSELQRLLGDEGMVSVGIGERQVFFRFADTEFKTNKIEGEFPNYEMVIPEAFNHNIPFEKASFLTAIKRASIISEDKNNSIIFHFKPGEVELSAMTFDLGSFRGSFPIEYEDEEFELAFNYKYLLDVLHVIETKRLTMHVKEPDQPVIFHEEGHEDTLYLIMPIKFSTHEATSGEE